MRFLNVGKKAGGEEGQSSGSGVGENSDATKKKVGMEEEEEMEK